MITSSVTIVSGALSYDILKSFCSMFKGGYQRKNDSERQNGVSIAYMSGTINHTEQRQFEKLMFRASRGKVLTRFHDQSFTIKDYDGNEKTKTVYVLVYQEGAQLQEKVTRVCQSFQGKIFTLPEDG